MQGFSALWFLIFALVSVVTAQTYRVHNNCPTAIDLFIGSESQGSLARGGTVVRNSGSSAGFFYTTTNGGMVNGRLVAARAGFFFEPQYWYYYLVRDPNTSQFNTGIRITPNQTEANGYCKPAECSTGTCTTAYTSPPVFHGGPPAPDSPPFPPPVYQCKVDPSQIAFDITFCPSGSWPPQTGTSVHHNYREKCIDVRGNTLANGTLVQIYDCNGTGAQQWVIANYGDTKLRVAGTNYCLDAGSSPGNGGQMKIWQCYDNLPAQAWTVTLDNRIVLQGTSLCLDLPSGNEANGQVLQVWTCTDHNDNQAWTIV